MASREKILVRQRYSTEWQWQMDTPQAYVRCIGSGGSFTFQAKAGALRSARAFAAKFKVQPDVVVEGEEK
jgi:hypothetical protein